MLQLPLLFPGQPCKTADEMAEAKVGDHFIESNLFFLIEFMSSLYKKQRFKSIKIINDVICVRYDHMSFKYLKTRNYVIGSVIENKFQLSNAMPIRGEVIWRLNSLDFLVVFHVSLPQGP